MCRNRPFFIIILLIAFSFSTYSHAYDLPDLGDPTSSALPAQKEQQLATELKQYLYQSPKTVSDPIVTDYLNSLGQHLVSKSAAAGHTFSYFLLRDPEINAFAAPGKIIGVNSGLFLATKSESELAAVLAHETSHIVQHHISRSIAQAKQLSIPALAGLIAGIALTAANPDLGAGAIAATMAGNAQSMINFTRAYEQEADRVGIDILNKAGFDPNSMANFFGRLQKQTQYNGQGIPEILLTHPVTAARIAEAENRAHSYPKHPYQDNEYYYFIKEQVRVDVATDDFQSIQYYRSLGNKLKSLPVRYGYALALTRANKFSEAEIKLTQLVQDDPNQLLFYLALADTYTQDKKYRQAIQTFTRAKALFPDDYTLLLLYARTLSEAGKISESIKLLEKLSRQQPKNPFVYTTLSRAYAAKHDIPNAYFSRASALNLIGYRREAIRMLEKALTLPKLNKVTEIKLRAKLKELQG